MFLCYSNFGAHVFVLKIGMHPCYTIVMDPILAMRINEIDRDFHLEHENLKIPKIILFLQPNYVHCNITVFLCNSTYVLVLEMGINGIERDYLIKKKSKIS